MLILPCNFTVYSQLKTLNAVIVGLIRYILSHTVILLTICKIKNLLLFVSLDAFS